MTNKDLRIAIVDSQKDEIQKLQEILAPICDKKQFLTFQCPKEALKLLETHPVDIILFNDCMPPLSSIDFLELLEMAFPNADMVLLSEKADSLCRAQVFEYGISDWILKPCSQEEILSRVRRILDFRRLEGQIRSLEETALKDSLTDLWNRRALEEEMERIAQLSSRYQMNYAVMMIDLDQFKKYNDFYGHLQGDKALKETGAIILESVRKSDFPGRFGGEEFLIILPYTNQEGADILAKRLVKAMEDLNFPHQHNPPSYKVSFTIGIAIKKENDPILSVVRKADKALYYGKKNGQKIVHYSQLCQ